MYNYNQISIKNVLLIILKEDVLIIFLLRFTINICCIDKI